MPKQTLEFLRHVALLGVVLGCITELDQNDKFSVLDDIGFIKMLIDQARKIRSMLMHKKSLFCKAAKSKSTKEIYQIKAQIAGLKSEYQPDEPYNCRFECLTFIRKTTDRAMYLGSTTHCTSTNQEQSLNFDINFVDSFLTKCSSTLDTLMELHDKAKRLIREISYDKWRHLIKNIQEAIVMKGLDSCFYSNLSEVTTSGDPDLLNDLEFHSYLHMVFDDMRYMLTQDKKALEKKLKDDEKRKVDSSTLPAYNKFYFQLCPFEQKSLKNDNRLQHCHFLVIMGLQYACSGHLLQSFNQINQMKIIDATLSFINIFRKDLSKKQCLIKCYTDLSKKEEQVIIRAALDKEAIIKENIDGSVLYEAAKEMIEEVPIQPARLKRKGTISMYSLAEHLRSPPAYRGRPSLAAEVDTGASTSQYVEENDVTENAEESVIQETEDEDY